LLKDGSRWIDQAWYWYAARLPPRALHEGA